MTYVGYNFHLIYKTGLAHESGVNLVHLSLVPGRPTYQIRRILTLYLLASDQGLIYLFPITTQVALLESPVSQDHCEKIAPGLTGKYPFFTEITRFWFNPKNKTGDICPLFCPLLCAYPCPFLCRITQYIQPRNWNTTIMTYSNLRPCYSIFSIHYLVLQGKLQSSKKLSCRESVQTSLAACNRSVCALARAGKLRRSVDKLNSFVREQQQLTS